MSDMPTKLDLDIVTPEQRVLAENVDEVILPAMDGYLGVRPGHAPLMARLHVGQLSYWEAGQEHVLALSGGYAEIQRGSVIVLAETCEPASNIDVERAEKAKQRAEARLKDAKPEHDLMRAEVALKRAVNRISTGARRQSMMN